MIDYRELSSTHADAYRRLRLRAVADEPRAFVDSPAEVQALPEEELIHRLDKHYMVGVFDGESLVGMAGYYINPQQKYSHRGYVHGVYLSPDYRGQKDADGKGIAFGMLTTLIRHAKEHVEHLELSVESNSPKAMALYERVGFLPYGRLPKVMKLPDGSYIDDIYMWLDISEATQVTPQGFNSFTG